ncbi:hypothetical protein OJ253_693 [Cryptosporidium canis]|uniref:Uncharacterized protein n=1 Tax=Cryptosporidium canis TaxID=195482 RepID=A0A9D5DIB9_9CRYT|nr:hypothetical protein OJ253_693 [Cryptosporidium canis]
MEHSREAPQARGEEESRVRVLCQEHPECGWSRGSLHWKDGEMAFRGRGCLNAECELDCPGVTRLRESEYWTGQECPVQFVPSPRSTDSRCKLGRGALARVSHSDIRYLRCHAISRYARVNFHFF